MTSEKLYPISFYSKEFQKRLYTRLLIAKTVERSIAGKEAEKILAFARDVHHIGGNQKVVDINGIGTAWSVKTYKCDNHSVKDTKNIQLISQRINRREIFDGTKNNNTIQDIGNNIILFRNDILKSAMLNYSDVREFVFMYDNKLNNVGVFEYRLHLIDPESLVWAKTSNDVYVGSDKNTNEHVCSWASSEGHFSIFKKVPFDTLYITVEDIKPFSDEEYFEILTKYRNITQPNFEDVQLDPDSNNYNNDIDSDAKCLSNPYQMDLDLW